MLLEPRPSTEPTETVALNALPTSRGIILTFAVDYNKPPCKHLHVLIVQPGHFNSRFLRKAALLATLLHEVSWDQALPHESLYGVDFLGDRCAKSSYTTCGSVWIIYLSVKYIS